MLEMGARNVLAALWPVADRSTAYWMTQLYRQWLNGASLGTAVLRAQQETRARWSSPYYWAAFTLYGSETEW